jgi:hypothetical protein
LSKKKSKRKNEPREMHLRAGLGSPKSAALFYFMSPLNRLAPSLAAATPARPSFDKNDRDVLIVGAVTSG